MHDQVLAEWTVSSATAWGAKGSPALLQITVSTPFVQQAEQKVQELQLRSSDILMCTQAAASNNSNPSPVNASPNWACIIKSDLKSEYRRI